MNIEFAENVDFLYNGKLLDYFCEKNDIEKSLKIY